MADEDAKSRIEWLVAEHHQAVYAYAFRLAGSATDAEDLTQQVFLVAQQRVDQLRRRQSARSWLFTILRHCFLRTWQRRRPVAATTVGLDLESVPAADPGEPIDAVGLQRALDELPTDFRLVLLMYYFEDRSYREIAEDLGLPIGTVMSRLARAKGHLRSNLLGQPSKPVRIL